VRQAAGTGTVVEVAGLTRSDAAGGFEIEFAELTAEIELELARVKAPVIEAPVVEDSADDVALAKSKGE